MDLFCIFVRLQNKYKMEIENLTKNIQGFLISDTHRQCTNRNCNTIFERTSKTVTLCPRCNCNRVKATHPSRKMFFRARSRAKLRGHAFEIDYTDIKIPDYCPILGMKLECYSGNSGGKDNSPALDRINNDKGYIKGNIMVISHLANVMKSSATPEILKKFAKWIINEFPDQV